MTSIDVVIPTLNEEARILPCLESVLAFEKSPDTRLTIYVVDGGSADRTRAIVRDVSARHVEVRLLDNPGRIQSCALNLVIRQGRGEYLLRLDAHAVYPRNYLALCLETMARTKADNVGGVFITLPGGPGYGARLVQAITTHRFGIGNSGFRLGDAEGPADTVPYGFFRREVFHKVGYFDQRLVRNQDYEFNARILAAGGKIWRNPRIEVHYFNQSGLGLFLRKQLLKEGPYNAYLWYLAPYAIALRHGITGLFALGVCVGALTCWLSPLVSVPFAAVLLLYFALGCIAGLQQAVRFHEWRHLFAVPAGLFLFHFCHGLGFLLGVGRIALGLVPRAAPA
jgi:glycosyltransferase involved in cell wall biosynthesis